MKFLLVPVLLATVAMAADVSMNLVGDAYNFGYNTGDAGGHSRSESGHGGTVSGAYSYIDPNGHVRRVSYTAGPDGFKPTGDIGVDQKTAADAAAIAALAPKAPLAPAPVAAPAWHPGYYGYHGYPYGHANVFVSNTHPGLSHYFAKW